MLKISAQIGEDFLGTAEELAQHVSAKLQALGFGDRHRTTERLVRFYTYENLISKPERANDDRRKANYGSLQVRQLLLARLLAERGWELDRIRNLLKDNAHVDKLNKLIDDLAQPNEAERLFFRTASPQPPERQDRPASMRSNRIYGMVSYDDDIVAEPSAAGAPAPRKSRFANEAYQQLRDLADSPMPALQFRKLVLKESMRSDLGPEVRELYQQLLAFHPTSRGEEPKRERWTRLRLAHWCEASFHIDNRGRPTEEELDEIVDKFRKALKDSYLRG